MTRERVVIEAVEPEIDCGQFPIKRTIGETVVVNADIFADGHDMVSARLLYRKEKEKVWTEVPMIHVVNDRWKGSFTVTELGRYRYTISAWIDHFKSWRSSLEKKVKSGQDVSIDLLIGHQLVEEAASRASTADAKALRNWGDTLKSDKVEYSDKISSALKEGFTALMQRYPNLQHSTIYPKELAVVVDREKARFSTWYEMFPRSCPRREGYHATLRDCEDHLPYIAEMGFDVLYFPPIHPIGQSKRKGRNNIAVAEPADPGSPWAIGAAEGGHKSIHPQLGTIEDFRRLVAKAHKYGIEIALDLAFQCSPDHPYAKEHPEWFRWRPDGTIQYAENPPKKYEDIYPLHFESEQWQTLWEELKSVVLFWVNQGVQIFRVDNPHTKPLRFWGWLINEVKKKHPEVIFLSEAFTRPKVMYHLAKVGFTQSYTYFAWRNAQWELFQYFTELTQTHIREFFRPNLWTNTPDILTEYLQFGGRPAFIARFILAATLGASYGLYGPAFELLENRPREPGREEYLDSEKYEVRSWNLKHPDSLKDLISRVNTIRRENPALHSDWSLRFHQVDNEQLICYSKSTEDLSNAILVVVNLDPHHTQSGWVDLNLQTLGVDPQIPYQVHDLLGDARYVWHGHRNYVELNPQILPAHIFRLRHRLRRELDFEYFM